jgi:hypothetical protein
MSRVSTVELDSSSMENRTIKMGFARLMEILFHDLELEVEFLSPKNRREIELPELSSEA